MYLSLFFDLDVFSIGQTYVIIESILELTRYRCSLDGRVKTFRVVTMQTQNFYSLIPPALTPSYYWSIGEEANSSLVHIPIF